VAHCGPALIGEFARTLTMTDLVTGWTENHSIRNKASKWITEGVEGLRARFPFPMVVFDSDCGEEFINHDVAGWLKARDIAPTGSRPYQKIDQAHVESKNNHVVFLSPGTAARPKTTGPAPNACATDSRSSIEE
jgi:hypothetical protein